jgi:N6-L-threonylcarbamoyladenine synthase
MYVLGIETSCDETAASVVKDGEHILSNVIAGQSDIHSRYGGVVPELAGRAHIDHIHSVVYSSVMEANIKLSEVDLIAVTQGPGLAGSLLVGLNFAKGLAYALKKPVIGINHLEGHLTAIFLQEAIAFPYIALSVSGGHTDLYRVDGFGHYKLLGQTRDDAAGECFDKVAKMMGLPYPGGPVIEKLARSGDSTAHPFPRSFLQKGSLDFSFSGLKTSVKNFLQTRQNEKGLKLSDADIAACFQTAVVDVLVAKLLSACKQERACRAVITGGVAANGALRQHAENELKRHSIKVCFPKPVFCTDNAAMIAIAGYHRYKEEPVDLKNAFELDALASLAL